MRQAPQVIAGEPELHAWCPVCLLPTRIRVPLHLRHTGAAPAAVLEICPGCGTGHDRPSVAVSAAPPGARRERHPLRTAAHALHRWACRRRGRTSRVCAHADCPWPGLYRHEHTVSSDDGVWRYVFCSRRHRAAWAAVHGITITTDRGDAR